MSVIRVITDEYHFWNWLKNSSGYQNNFSLDGAKAVFNYYDNLSDELDKPIEFDPIAWCCEFSEYDSVLEVWRNYHDEQENAPEYDQMLEWLQDQTTVLELDKGVIVAEF